jgi:hypothetical protein
MAVNASYPGHQRRFANVYQASFPLVCQSQVWPGALLTEKVYFKLSLVRGDAIGTFYSHITQSTLEQDRPMPKRRIRGIGAPLHDKADQYRPRVSLRVASARWPEHYDKSGTHGHSSNLGQTRSMPLPSV